MQDKFDIELEIKNFMSVRKAKLKSNNELTVLVAPNKAGKTQILFLLYSIFWTWWRVAKDNHFLVNYGGTTMRDSKTAFKESGEFFNTLKRKIKRVFLLNDINEILTWDKQDIYINLDSKFLLTQVCGKPIHICDFNVKDFKFFEYIQKSPIYLHPSGLGDYYKGIHSLKKYYPEWSIVTEAVVDLIDDLFIVASEKVSLDRETLNLMDFFETLFSSKFFMQREKIFVQEGERKYSLERTASGLKSLSWLYLILKYNLLGNFLFIDEPEVSLHPEFIDKLAFLLYKISLNRKLFIATHSDYLLESFNKLMNKYDFKIDVWIGRLEDGGAIYSSYEANKDNLIDTSPLTNVYLDILKEGFGYEKD